MEYTNDFTGSNQVPTVDIDETGTVHINPVTGDIPKNETFWDKQIEAFQSLLKAIKDQGEGQKGAVKAWVKAHLLTAILWGIAVFVIIRVMSQDTSQYRKGHHGINKYGERY